MRTYTLADPLVPSTLDVLSPQIARLAPPRQAYAAGIDIMQQGEPSHELFFVEQGMVKLLRLEGHGRQVIVDLCFGNVLLGAEAALCGQPHAVTATTVTRSQIRRLAAAAFADALCRDPGALVNLCKYQGSLLTQHRVRLGEFGSMSGRARLIRILRQLAITAGAQPATDPGLRLHVPLRDYELSDLVGVTPQHFCKLVRELSRDGVVYKRQGWFVVPDLSALE
jgi:CRP/FNR family transcriptional regulator, cyclic AMP receptor protein